ncbi:MAG: hypothetical protein IBX67_03170 [Dehalococcoidia bacterium]|nr:hypothetical protein [Dehalococcoidia bacterium]
MAQIQGAFLFVFPGADPKEHRTVVAAPAGLELTVIGVKDFGQAADVAKELAAQGVGLIELCGGFGHIGAAEVARAVQGKAQVGVVRFDAHPGLGFKSGDEFFR